MSDTNRPHDGSGYPGNGYPGYGSEQGHDGGPAPYGSPAPAPAPAPSAGPAPYGSPAPAPAPAPSAPSAGPAPWASSAGPGPTSPGPSTPGESGASATREVGTGAAQLAPTLRRLGIGNPLPTFAAGALAYLAALGAAIVVIISLVLAVVTAGLPDVGGGVTDPLGGPSTPSGTGGPGFRGILGVLGIPFQLVALASFGSYDIDLALGFLGNISASWRGMPLLITVVMAGTAFLASLLVQRRWGSGKWGSNGPLGAFLWSGISGLAVAIFAVIVTRITAFGGGDDELGVSVSMHTAGFDMFLGTWALIGIPIFLGHLAGMEKPHWWHRVADLAAAPRLALTHALTFAVPVAVVATVIVAIQLLADGDGRLILPMFLLLPAWGLNALAVLPGLGMLVVPLNVTMRGDLPDVGVERMNEMQWLFNYPWYAWIPTALFALAVLVLIPLLWNRGRHIEKGDVLAQIVSWLALPCTYFVGSLVLMALVWTRVNVEMGGWGSTTMAVGYGLAAWMPLVAFIIGAIVEVLARFGAPFVDRFIPGVLVNWFRRSERKRREAGADPAPGSGSTAPGGASSTAGGATAPSDGAQATA